jgi:hypothetical protein
MALAVPALGAGTVHAAPTSNSGIGVGTFCQQYGTVFSQSASTIFSSILQSPVNITLSKGACASLISTFIAGTYDSSAPTVSICKSLASSGSLPSGLASQAQCVSALSSSGFKQEINYIVTWYGISLLLGP